MFKSFYKSIPEYISENINLRTMSTTVKNDINMCTVYQCTPDIAIREVGDVKKGTYPANISPIFSRIL